MQNTLKKLMYFWMINTDVSLEVSKHTMASSHGRWLSELKMTAISVVVLSSVHNGFLLLHIVCKCKQLYIIIVGTEHTENHKIE